MRYESEILYDLMKRDGLLNPSQDNLPYESELKEKYVNDVVGAYPKLQDYRAEWLNYNKCEYIPADFPTESQTNQTSGTFQNVVPFAYERAILSGQTLVNLSCLKDINMQQNQTVKISTETGKKGTVYTFKFFVSKNNDAQKIRIRYYNGTSLGILSDYSIVDGLNNLKITTKTEEECIYFSISNLSSEINIQDFIILEGDYTNQDIPYFEGMQSVKMPVLTTTGKNLFDGKLANGFLSDSTGQPNTSSNNHKYTPSFIKIDASKKYCLHVEADSFIGVVNAYYYDYNKNYLGVGRDIITGINTNISKLFTPHYKAASYIRFRFYKPDSAGLSIDTKNIAFYESSTIIDMYEPYKSIILTVNEDVTLRSNGSVYDELDLLTGKLTQRIDEDGGVLTQEVIKTVDLSCINENNGECDFIPFMDTMHYQTSSNTIPPLVDLTVCVEATTQNLASFVDLDGVEHNE